MSTPPQIDVSIPTRAIVIVGVLIVVLALIHYYFPSTKGTVIFFAAASAAGGAILTAFYAAKALEISIHSHNNQITQDRKEAAMRFGERWNNPSMYYSRECLRKILDMSAKNDPKLKQTIDSESTNLIHVMNFFEEIAGAIKFDTLNVDIVINQFGGIMVCTWDALEEWVEEYRALRRCPEMWVVLEELLKKWEGG